MPSVLSATRRIYVFTTPRGTGFQMPEFPDGIGEWEFFHLELDHNHGLGRFKPYLRCKSTQMHS
ncbi:hypothetical protein GYMLUDRAFT_90289 [Collybiopsis luxurians FD-317 M1]|nr:hypothetical protein GYMLUDRAFT_90289 [Collybiopsis luxurians FD-317 M1]